MEQLRNAPSANYREAENYYALALNVVTARYANQLKAASILEAIFQRQPAPPASRIT